MNRLIRIIVTIVLGFIVAGTLGFTYLQIQRTQTLDEGLVSDLTTQLDKAVIDQAIERISNESQ